MKIKTSAHPQRGSALGTVLMISLGVLLVVASMMSYSMTERRLNYREAMRIEARNAAEAISEYGLSQVRQLMSSRSDYTSARFTTGTDSGVITLPTTTFWGGGNIATTGTTAPELIIGVITAVTTSTTSALYYFDPNDPNNSNEPLKGRYAFRFDVKVISKATVVPPTTAAGAAHTACMTQTLSARASPLFSHAIFYNMDLEFWPGGNMTVAGGVHTNGRLFVRKWGSSGSYLYFVGPVTTAKGLYTTDVKYNAKFRSGATDTITAYTDQHSFLTAAGGLVSAWGPAPGTTTPSFWRDYKWNQASETAATRESFRLWATATYGGNLMTGAHGVQVYNPVAIGDYVEDTTPADGVDQSVNDARKMIEAPLTSADAGYNVNVEAQKYSTRCGLYIVVNNSTTTRTGRLPNGTSVSLPAGKFRAFTNAGTEVILPGQPDYGTNNTTANTTGNQTGRAIVRLNPTAVTDMRRTNFNFGASRSSTNAYVPKAVRLIDIDMVGLKMAIERTFYGATSSTVYDTAFPTATTWTNSIYNPAGTPSNAGAFSTVSGINAIGGLSSTAWNGGIYIHSVDAETRKDSGVRLINGRGRVATATSPSGLSVTTNDALYILGHYNADGTIDSSTTSTTFSARYPDGGIASTSEVPTAVAADAITILSHPTYAVSGTTYIQSSGWNDALSPLRVDTGWVAGWATTNPSSTNLTDGTAASTSTYKIPYDSSSGTMGAARDTKFAGAATEMSAALLTGQVPSNKNNTTMSGGGVHNFPRLLENWGATFAIRGSMVAMFESRIAGEPWSIRNYSAPTRLWGFHEFFNTGRFPPLTPTVMSYRRVDFSDITAVQYAAVKASWGL